MSDDYYLQEIKYPGRIDEINNAASLDYQIEIRQGPGYIEAVFPNGDSISGQIHFYRPDNERLDRKFDFEGTALVSKSDLAAGRYKIKISWTDSERLLHRENNCGFKMIAAAFLIVFGSLHCVGMCRPLALALPLPPDRKLGAFCFTNWGASSPIASWEQFLA